MISPSRAVRVAPLAVAALMLTACLPAEDDAGGGNAGGASALDEATRVMVADGRALAKELGFRAEEITTGPDSKTCESGGANRIVIKRTATAREGAYERHEAIFNDAEKALRERGYRSTGNSGEAFRPGAAGGTKTSEWRKAEARLTFTIRRADGGMSPDGKTHTPVIFLRGTTDCLSS